MPSIPAWRRYLRFFGPNVSADVDDELRFHLESKVEELRAQGWPPDLARAEAARQFGEVAAIRRTCESIAKRREQQMQNTERLSAFYQDVKYGFNQLRHSFGTTLLALVTLGIGTGVVTAAFSVVYAVVLRPLPFPDADRLVSAWSVRGGVDDVMTPRNFDALRRQAHSFVQLGAMQPTTFALSNAGDAKQIPGGFISAGYLQAFGTSPELGRTFTAEEDQPPRLHLVVLSHQLWQEQFNADRHILGTQIRLNREAFTVIGVMPSSFSILPGSEEAWVPLALSGQEMSWSGGILRVVGRLRPGVAITQAQAEMNVLAQGLAAQYPDMNHDRGIRVRDYAADVAGDYKTRLLILLGAVGFVLLIACANVANLLLARGAGRTQELAVRAALGASRFRILRQLLTESLLVGLAGAGLGLGLAHLLVAFVPKLGFDAIPRLAEACINGPVLLFAVGLGIVSTLLAGLIPALRAAQVDIQVVLRQGGRSATGSIRDRSRNVYIAGEVALALVLLVSAGLLIRTAIAAQHIQLGFSTSHLLSGRTALPDNVYTDSNQIAGAYERILRELRSQPGVLSAALSSKIPLSVSTVGLALKQNSVSSPLQHDFATELHYVSDGYLATMEIPLLAGREFDLHDRSGSAQVILVSQSLARHLWPNGSSIGRTVRISELEGRRDEWQVIGIVADVRANGQMSEPPPEIYLPITQVSTHPWHWIEQSLYLVARTQTDALSLSGLLKNSLTSVDAELPLGDIRTMEQRLARAAAVAHFYTLILTILGGCGLLLTMAGIYGVVAYFVRTQRAEMGIRLALGSSKAGVMLVVIRQGMRPVLVGIGLGLTATLIATRLLATQLYGVSTTDPLTLTAVTLTLISAAALACYLPAREATKVDPMVALRNE